MLIARSRGASGYSKTAPILIAQLYRKPLAGGLKTSFALGDEALVLAFKDDDVTDHPAGASQGRSRGQSGAALVETFQENLGRREPCASHSERRDQLDREKLQLIVAGDEIADRTPGRFE